MDDEARKAYYAPSPPPEPWEAEDYGCLLFLLLVNVWWIGPVLVLIAWGLAVTVRHVAHFGITTISAHWSGIVICLAIAATMPWLVRLWIYLLLPPIRRASIKLYYLNLRTAERWRYKRARRDLTEAYQRTRRRIQLLSDGDK